MKQLKVECSSQNQKRTGAYDDDDEEIRIYASVGIVERPRVSRTSFCLSLRCARFIQFLHSNDENILTIVSNCT